MKMCNMFRIPERKRWVDMGLGGQKEGGEVEFLQRDKYFDERADQVTTTSWISWLY